MKLLILPGVNSGAYLFEAATDFLRGVEVLAVDPPGIGKPAMLELKLPFTPKAYAREVVKLLEKKGWDKFILLGHSLGGFAAQELAHMVPEKIEKLILVSTSAGQPATTRDVSAMPAKLHKSFWEINQLIEKNPQEGMKAMFGKSYPTQHPHEYAAFIKARSANLAGTAVSLAHLGAGGTFASGRWVKQLKLPTLVIQGSDDVLISATSGRELASLLPEASYIELHGVGHFPMLEHESFWKYVAEFMAGHEPGQKVQPARSESFWAKLKEIVTRHG